MSVVNLWAEQFFCLMRHFLLQEAKHVHHYLQLFLVISKWLWSFSTHLFFFFTQTTIVSGRLAWAGLFKNGKSYGAHWRGCFGGGFLYGSVGPNGLFTGNKNAYIYPGKK